MYKNRPNRTATNLDLQSLIRRCDIEFDQRARYVEFVCDMWNEGRFGIGRPYPMTIKWNDRPEPEPASFLDLDDSAQDAPNRLHPAISPPSALKIFLGRPVEVALRRAKQMGLSEAWSNVRNPTSALTPNQGRGSP